MRKLLALLLLTVFIQNCCYAGFFKKGNNNVIDSSKGYVGTLPDLTQEYSSGEGAVSTPIFDKIQDFHSENKIKPTPKDDPVFVNIILKKDKTSPYVNDIQEFIEMFEQISDSIESEEDVQLFASRVYYLNINTDSFSEKYAGKPESNYSSYKEIINVSNMAKNIAELRRNAEKYKKYLAYTDVGSEYSPNSINTKLFDLKLSIEKVLVTLKNTE